MLKAVILVTLAAAANCALLPSNGLQAPSHYYQPQQRTVLIQPQHHQYTQQSHVQSGVDAAAQVLRSDAVVNPDSFQYNYETSNGIVAQEAGQLKQIGQEAAIASQGQFGYTAPDGTPIQLTYIADENGFQPQGAHLPTPPPVPAAIARAVEYLLRVAPQQQQQQQQKFFQRF